MLPSMPANQPSHQLHLSEISAQLTRKKYQIKKHFWLHLSVLHKCTVGEKKTNQIKKLTFGSTLWEFELCLKFMFPNRKWEYSLITIWSIRTEFAVSLISVPLALSKIEIWNYFALCSLRRLIAFFLLLLKWRDVTMNINKLYCEIIFSEFTTSVFWTI